MKPTLAADEMFPEGAGYMDMEEVSLKLVQQIYECWNELRIF